MKRRRTENMTQTINAHILIAEDEKYARHTLGLALRMAGYQVTLAEDGQEALDKLLELATGPGPIDMLITDIQMPRVDGLLLLDLLKEKGIAIPVVGITGFGDKEMVVELLRRGCRDYLDKPFTPQDFLGMVEKVLGQSRSARYAHDVRLRRLEIDRSKMQQEVKKYKESFELLWRQFGSAVDAYRKLISEPGETRKVPLAWRNLPLSGLGGDYLDIRDTEVGCDILLADVAGHDMGAFYHAVLIKSFFEEHCRKIMDVKSFFRLLNTHLLDRGGNERLVRAILLRLDLEHHQGYVVSAGYPPLIADLGKAHGVQQVAVSGSVLGLWEEVDFSVQRFALSPGDRYFVCSDGVVNARRTSAPDERLGIDGLVDLVGRFRGKTIRAVVRQVWSQVQAHCGGKTLDDMVLLGLEIPGTE